MAFPATYNITYYKGDTYEFVIKPKTSNGQTFPIPSNEYTAHFYIAQSRNDSSSNTIEASASISSISYEVTNKAVNSNIATLTTSQPHDFVVGEAVTVSGVDFVYSITNKELQTNVATLTTSVNHSFVVGDIVTISGVDSVFNGSHTITVITDNTFSFAKTNTNISSTSASGSATYTSPKLNGNHIITAITSTTFSYSVTANTLSSTIISPSGSAESLNPSFTDSVTCLITPYQGNLLDPTKTYVYDVSIKKIDNPNIVYTLLTGTISITGDVTPKV